MTTMNQPKNVAAEQAEQEERRARRKGSYHLVASKNQLVENPEDEEDDFLFNFLIQPPPVANRREQIQQAKTQLIRSLAKNGGDVSTPEFQTSLDNLTKLYDVSSFDARKLPPRPSRKSRGGSYFKREQPSSTPVVEGMWISLQKPRFQDCVGVNQDGYTQYTLGRMSFDKFRPGDLVCSIQGTFNPVHVVDGRDVESIKHVPKSLFSEVREGSNVLRRYDVVTAFTIEPRDPKFGPNSPNQKVDQPVEGLLTTHGFALPNPDIPNRLSIWFTEGSIEVNNDTSRWKKIFDSVQHEEARGAHHALHHRHGAPSAASKVTMEADGRMSYKLTQPAGGHDTSYIDVLYLDNTMRVMKSSRGEIYVFARVPSFPDE